MTSILFILFVTIQTIIAQQTGITCSNVIPIDVPRDPKLFWGTWYVLATCDNCTNPSNYCTQVKLEPIDATNTYTNVTYIGSYQNGSPDGTNSMAFGNLSPLNFDTFDPVYRLALDLGVTVVSNYWVLTTAESDGEITAAVTMSCLPTNTDQQIFFWSRKPYFVPPVTFDALVAQTRRAIDNYDEFNIVPVVQSQGWCDYELTETTNSNCNNDDGDDVNSNQVKIAAVFALLATILSFFILCLLICMKFFPQFCQSSSTTKQPMSTLL